MEREDFEYGYKVDLEVFSGPLDLLLYLIRQQEVEITDVSIAQITDQYLQHIEVLQQINVNLAGEFLLMAATLMEIKSRLLLPRHEEDEAEEEEDPRADLIRQLIEYKKFKDAARGLGARADEQALKFTRGAAGAIGLPEREPVEDLPIVLGETSVWDLVAAFKTILRQTSFQAVRHIVLDQKPASVCCNELLDLLRGRPNVLFRDLFDPGAGRMAIVAAFLALLELIRRRRVRAEQVGPEGNIRILLLDDTPVSEIELAEEQPRPEPAQADLAPESFPPDEEEPPDEELDRIAVPEVEPLAEAPLSEADELVDEAVVSPARATPPPPEPRPPAPQRAALPTPAPWPAPRRRVPSLLARFRRRAPRLARTVGVVKRR